MTPSKYRPSRRRQHSPILLDQLDPRLHPKARSTISSTGFLVSSHGLSRSRRRRRSSTCSPDRSSCPPFRRRCNSSTCSASQSQSNSRGRRINNDTPSHLLDCNTLLPLSSPRHLSSCSPDCNLNNISSLGRCNNRRLSQNIEQSTDVIPGDLPPNTS